LPIARATGGLRDTIEHWRTGFLFDHATSNGVLWACSEAIKVYRDQPEHWQYMVQQAMAEDFSWQRSARAYGDIYEMVKRA
jgi:starch synthase